MDSRRLRTMLVLLVLVAAHACGGKGPAERGAPADSAPEPGSAAAAAAVVHDYYAAIAAGDYARAYAHWGNAGAASGQTFDEFRAGYAGTASVRAEVGEPGWIEGAAGSRYVDVPAEVRAVLADGTSQCFRGTYTLRRTVIEGSTPAQRRWHFASADLAPCAAGRDSAAAVAVVERFGRQVSRVSLLAPPDTVRREIRDVYGPLVTPPLLAVWLRDPSTAPGRQTSSPWPDRIEVGGVRRIGPLRYEIQGRVVWVTSVEKAGGAVERRPVTLEVRRGPDREWRIDTLRK